MILGDEKNCLWRVSFFATLYNLRSNDNMTKTILLMMGLLTLLYGELIY
ncbi:hypothetical protein HMPREF1870_02786 [Bacteroidales bacterium KA00344]|nr:hypothetical protein HMPREF1870_02786 [Bacteroidales bacterium KA00344]